VLLLVVCKSKTSMLSQCDILIVVLGYWLSKLWCLDYSTIIQYNTAVQD
jgi:hypothetical protein